MSRRRRAEIFLPLLALALGGAFAVDAAAWPHLPWKARPPRAARAAPEARPAHPPGAAQAAGPAQEAGLAMGACLAAVIDRAPVDDVEHMGVAVHRESAPNLCTVRVTAGDPELARQAIMRAVNARPEGFQPARTRWDPAPFVSRETLCSAPGRRPLNVVVETGRAGEPLALSATVVETPQRDPRCDLDYGIQHP